MEVFEEYLSRIDNLAKRARMEEVFNWIMDKYPKLSPKIAWNQPMFTDHGTFIIGFSISKHHMAVAPEKVWIEQFTDLIKQSGYEHTKELVRIPWSSTVEYSLLESMIDFNIADKADCTTFWRKID
ncbi:iron chaperone [Anaerocolumna sp. AGMB13025]|uniref:iron chaperone n=1 Tax=Anaerocolumna sp. AGMB13025 TaxID=3039116 RepID=UPI00241C63EA|nr:iron chaperone [Anaerocolumna sp. AGMB13025]WFR59034.1 iron chaperone [Anaerocolumna sp. AGMB13025]